MIEQWLRGLNEWTLFVALLALLLGAAEIGLRVAWRLAPAMGERDVAEIATIQAAALGLLALLLGFTFSMAASRFETRKELVRDEANAIGTAYLRTQLLPEPQRTNAARLLREYVDTRLELQRVGHDASQLSAVNALTAKVQDQLWAEVVAAADKDPRSIMTGLVVQSINDMIDMHGKELAALRNRIPMPIFMLLCFVALVAVGLTGYGCGAGRKRNLALTLMMAVLIAAVIMLIVDLHRPTRGFITLDLQSLLDVREGMGPARR